ncbi:DUF2785 domain-containing protein [Lysobacter sp. M15]|uniref:DUF2785 domain-containing protein n=1 Tax=Lysobacter sp. M15 TaxID=2916837 RepID=UPI001F56B23D|nr:DUF2785 domain-containing protein [Lysobacter sp. M15]
MRLMLIVLLMLAAAPAMACPPPGYDKPALQALKKNGFAVADPARRRELAQALVGCLGDPDPELRDGIAFEALSQWMRADAFDAAQVGALRDRLYGLLDGPEGEGYARPFAALVLSEVARTDRIKPWMSVAERAAMVDKAAAYVEGVRDYRGYDDVQGWRHGVAHGADWLMQLALNPALDRAQADRILAAVIAQAVPASGHAYVFGEPERLARPVLFVAQRGLHSDAEWAAWFAALVPRIGDAKQAYRNVAWLARRHDLSGLLQNIYLQAGNSQDPKIRTLQPAVLAAIKAIP